MDIAQTVTYAARHIVEWIPLGLLALFALSLVFHYATNRRRYS